MDPEALETMAMRAVELRLQGRTDPRLLLATKQRMQGPRKTARLLAGLANAADGRTPLLLMGITRNSVIGVDQMPGESFWRRVADAFTGLRPSLTTTSLKIGTALVIAVHIEGPDGYVAAARGDRTEVPFFHNGALQLAPPQQTRAPHTSVEHLPSIEILGGWIERSVMDDGDPITAYRGWLDVELGASSGFLADKDCSATLLVSDEAAPIALDVQVHAISEFVGVRRRDAGIEVEASFRARMFLAAALTDGEDVSTGRGAQLVASLILPGRSVPEIRSLLLSPDPQSPDRWIV